MGAGVAVATLGDTALFAPCWDGFAAVFADGGPVPTAVHDRTAVWVAPIDALLVLHYAPLAVLAWRATDRRWGGRVGVWSVLAWFTVDSASGIATGAAFNVVLINLPAAALTVAAFAWLARPPPST